MKICLCGSTRFMDQFNAANRLLTLAGHVVYSVATASSGDHPQLTMDEKLLLDAVHLSKIDESEAVVIVGRQEDGTMYIGDSTRREMMYARVREKNVYFYDPTKPVEGPFGDFVKDIGAAYTSDAQRKQLEEEEEKRRKDWMDSFRVDDKGENDDDSDEEVDHSDDPEAEKTTN